MKSVLRKEKMRDFYLKGISHRGESRLGDKGGLGIVTGRGRENCTNTPRNEKKWHTESIKKTPKG